MVKLLSIQLITSIIAMMLLSSTTLNAQNYIWAKSIGGTSSDAGRDIALDASGNVYTTGYFRNNVDFDPGVGIANLTTTGQEDIFISKSDINGNYIWAKSIGGTQAEIGYAIAVDASGNVYTTGYFSGTVDFDPGAGVANLTTNGSPQIYISKLDANGNYAWAIAMIATTSGICNDISIDNSGNVYTTGSFRGTIDFDPGASTSNSTSNGGADVFISKLNANGNFLWAKAIGGLNTDVGNDITFDASGNVYTTGQFSGTVDFDPSAGIANQTSNTSVASDIFISKLDMNGNFVWAKTMGGPNGEAGNSTRIDANGNIYTTGNFGGTTDFDPGIGVANLTSIGIANIFITKLDANGNFVWAKAMGGTGDCQGHGIALDASGNVYTTGYFRSTSDFDPGASTTNITSNGQFDIFISKLDVNGNFIWAKTMGGTLEDLSFGIALDGTGNVYTAGYFSSTVDFDPGVGIVNLTSNGSFEMFISKLGAFSLPVNWLNVSAKLNNQNHSELNWEVSEKNVMNYEIEKSIDGAEFSAIETIKSKGDGTNEYFYIDNEILIGKVFYRIKQIDIDGRFSYSDIMTLERNADTRITIYPNPTSKYLKVILDKMKQGSVTVKLIDLNGRTINELRSKASNGIMNLQLDLSTISKGNYLLEIKNNDVVLQTEKITKIE